MPFNSIRFLLFLALAAGLYRWIPLGRRPLALLVFSYIFYFTWSAPHALILLAATAAAYWAGPRVKEGGSAALPLCLLALLGGLAFYKCAALGPLTLAMPLGISYYTFKLMSYVLDVAWGKAEPERSFVSLAAYAAFFPQIMSGPIQRAPDFLSQLPGRPSGQDLAAGLRLILFGLFQKLVVADRLAVFVDSVYADPAAHPGWPLMAAAAAFSLQLFADFSGLTDMAIGSARLFGIRSPENFDAPFSARSTVDFWRRWHMTLTSWLRDYAFTPLQLSWRGAGDPGLAASLFLLMLAVGAWHGLQGHFLLFGAFNGLCLAASALTMSARDRFFDRSPWLKPARAVFAPLLTFLLMSAAFVFFRAENVPKALAVFAGIFKAGALPGALPGLEPGGRLVTLAALAVMLAAQPLKRRAEGEAKLLTAAFYAVIFVFLLAARPLAASKFIYFQF